MKIKVRKRGGGGGPELKYLDTCSFLSFGPWQGRSAEPSPAELRLHKTLLFSLPRLQNFFFFFSISSFPTFSDITSWYKISWQEDVKTPHWGSGSLRVSSLPGAHSATWPARLSVLPKPLLLHYKSLTGQKPPPALHPYFVTKNVKVIKPSAGLSAS